MSLDDTSSREIRSFDVVHKFLDSDIRIVNICTDCITAFAEIVRSHVGRHTHGDTGSSVQKQKRHLGRQNRRLLKRVIEVILKIDCILVKVSEDLI